MTVHPARMLLTALVASACADLNTSTISAPPPVITAQPTPQMVVAGTPATFTVFATGDSLTYQWYKNAAAISGATANVFTIGSAAPADAGAYQVVVSNSAAAIASDTAALTVVVPQVIIGYKLVGGVASSTNQSFSSAAADESAVLVSAGGDLTLINGTVSKTGHASSLSTSRATGANAAILVAGGSKATLVGTTITTDSIGATGLFATGAASTIAAFRGSITTTSSTSYGLAATLGGSVRVERTSIRAASGVIASATGASSIAIIAVADSLAGTLVADATSTLAATLSDGTRLTGALQGVALAMDSTSTWTVTATSALTTLSLPGGISGSSISNIVGNGYTVSYRADLAANATLGGRTYALAGGGSLVPR